MDAKFVLDLLNNMNVDNHPLGHILLDCRLLMQGFESISIKHIYRKANLCADALANDTPFSVGDLYVNLLYANLIGLSYPRTVNV